VTRELARELKERSAAFLKIAKPGFEEKSLWVTGVVEYPNDEEWEERQTPKSVKEHRKPHAGKCPDAVERKRRKEHRP
jgi:hypothetical protein